MPANAAYRADDEEKPRQEWVEGFHAEKVYSYDEAIDLAGHGWYTVWLVAVLSVTNLYMAVEIFGISAILSGAKCEYALDLRQTSVLLTVSFIGPIIMAYPWGYLADTKGRRHCLLISLWMSCLFSSAVAFSPNWITMGILKLLSTSFVSCAQATTYTLLGESCPRRVRDAYMLVLASALNMSLTVYMGLAYVTLNQNFSFNLGIFNFTPWRLLAILLALPLGVSAFGLHFFYESPRFLYNSGREEEALDALRAICRQNGGDAEKYPVKTIFLNEDSFRPVKGSLLRSLWDQVVPLFKPPLLKRSLQLYFITVVVYGTNNSYFMWFAFLAEQFVIGLSQDSQSSSGLCNVIVYAQGNTTDTTLATEQCSTNVDIGTFYTSVIQGTTFVLVLLSITKLAHRKRLLVIIILAVSGVCSALAVAVKNNIFSLIMFVGLLTNEMIIGLISSYYVDLYPTSYRGTAACLGTVVARLSALAGVSLVGSFIMSHCDVTFYVSAAIMFSGVLVGLLLPPDRPAKDLK